MRCYVFTNRGPHGQRSAGSVTRPGVKGPIVIVADDLTGAIDSAAPFAARGMRVRIALHVDAIAEAAGSDPQVLAIDTRSRGLPPALAAERVAAAWHAMAPLSPALVIKKVDSRLKGECAAEVGRLLPLSGRELAVICPAVPDQQRVISQGMLTGRGIDRPIAIADRFPLLPTACPDAVDQQDLAAIASGILADPARILAVGAGGLAAALADIICGPARDAQAPAPELPMLIAIGSQDAITAGQVARLRLEHPDVDHPEIGDGGAIHLRRMPPDPQPDPALALTRFGDAMAGMAQAAGARTLLCSGGDTAGAIMDALAVRQLMPDHEWGAGIPVARVVGRPRLRLITKSGGFGDPDVLARIARHARTGTRQDAA